MRLKALIWWNILNDEIPLQFKYAKTNSTSFSLGNNEKSGMSHVFDDIIEMVDDLLDKAYEIYYEEHQENQIEKLIEHVEVVKKSFYEEATGRNLVGEHGIVHAEQHIVMCGYK